MDLHQRGVYVQVESVQDQGDEFGDVLQFEALALQVGLFAQAFYLLVESVEVWF